MKYDIKVQTPQRRKDHFLAKMATMDNQKVRVRIDGASWIHMHPIDDDGFVLRLFLPEGHDCMKTFRSLDEQVLEQTVENNATWFPNAMTEEMIHAYFRYTVNQSSIGTYVSSWKDPIVILNNKQLDSIHDLTDVPKTAAVRAEVEAMGVCFFRQKFGIRWFIRKLWVTTTTKESGESEADVAVDREAVEAMWEQELLDLHKYIENEKDLLQQKIQTLDAFYSMCRTRLSHSKEMADPKTWNEELESLSKLLAKYRSGAVTSVQ